jgi:hypothetical protein
LRPWAAASLKHPRKYIEVLEIYFHLTDRAIPTGDHVSRMRFMVAPNRRVSVSCSFFVALDIDDYFVPAPLFNELAVFYVVPNNTTKLDSAPRTT